MGTPAAASLACSAWTSRTCIQIITECPGGPAACPETSSNPGPRKNTTRDRLEGRTPGRWPGPACRGRSGGCGPSRWAAAGSGCSERPRDYFSSTLSDRTGQRERARSRRSGRRLRRQHGCPRCVRTAFLRCNGGTCRVAAASKKHGAGYGHLLPGARLWGRARAGTEYGCTGGGRAGWPRRGVAGGGGVRHDPCRGSRAGNWRPGGGLCHDRARGGARGGIAGRRVGAAGFSPGRRRPAGFGAANGELPASDNAPGPATLVGECVL